MEKVKKFTILYVDDEESNLNIFRNTFRREYNVLTASSAIDGLEILKNQSIDLILTDQRMPDMDGISFLKQTIQQFPGLNRILITGYTDFDALKSAINEARIFQYIQKPWREEQLRSIIDQALEIYVLRQENESLNNQLIDKNKELERINYDLLEFDKLKMDFLSIISHEIRTPLNGIVGSVDLIKRDIGHNGFSSFPSLITILDTSVSRLEKFLLSAERITQLKSQAYPIIKEITTPSSLIDSLISRSKDKFSQKRILIKKQVNSNPEIYADLKLVSFSLDEILDNAIKHSPNEGSITINCYTHNDLVNLDIIDQGSGFSEKMLKNAFQVFVSDNRNDLQKGLSLALIKHIMDNHCGGASISNLPEGGAKVSLAFNVKK
jgi:signal transduction histidine kinase